MPTHEPEPVDRPAPGHRVRRLAVLLAAALALLLGCQSFALLFKDRPEGKTADKEPTVTPPPGAPCKYSFRIAPYVFLSDFEIKPELPLFQELAGLRDQVYSELKLPPGTAVIQVYLFEDRERYDQFMKARHPDLPPRRAFFIAQQRRLGGSDDLLVYTFWDLARIQQDLRHELTHALLHSVLKDVPIWLDEGLAEYFELPPDRHGVNRLHVERLRHPGRPVKLDLARLEAIREVKDMTAVEYREAWAWAHFLLHGPAEARPILLNYLAQLRRDASPPPLSPQLLKVFLSLDDLLDRHLAQLDDRRRAEAR